MKSMNKLSVTALIGIYGVVNIINGFMRFHFMTIVTSLLVLALCYFIYSEKEFSGKDIAITVCLLGGFGLLYGISYAILKFAPPERTGFVKKLWFLPFVFYSVTTCVSVGRSVRYVGFSPLTIIILLGLSAAMAVSVWYLKSGVAAAGDAVKTNAVANAKANQLKPYDDLLAKGVITREEYEAKKAEIERKF